MLPRSIAAKPQKHTQIIVFINFFKNSYFLTAMT